MEYICPMGCEGNKTYPDPEDCPKCGMHLIKVAGLRKHKGDSEELKLFYFMRKKLIISAIFSIPVLILSMGELVPGIRNIIEYMFSRKTNILTQFVFSLPVIFYAGLFIFQKGIKSVITRNLNMFTLISIGNRVQNLFQSLVQWVQDASDSAEPTYSRPVISVEVTRSSFH